MHVKDKCPCRGCTLRVVGCRSNCPKPYGYSQWQEELLQDNALHKESKRERREYYDYKKVKYKDKSPV